MKNCFLSSVRINSDFRYDIRKNGINTQINVEEQKLETTVRNGFVVVEWGGTEIIF